MSTVKGILKVAKQTPAGYFSINVDDKWYGTFKDDHSALEGKAIVFEASQKGEWWNANKVRIDPDAAQPAAPAAGRPQSHDERQASIVLQSSYKTAAELLSSLVIADKLTLGAKKDTLDITLGVLDEMALHIYSRCSNPLPYLAGVAGSPDQGNPDPEADGYSTVNA